jgi:hypothetical protein
MLRGMIMFSLARETDTAESEVRLLRRISKSVTSLVRIEQGDEKVLNRSNWISNDPDTILRGSRPSNDSFSRIVY